MTKMGKETKIINESDFSKRFKVCENDSKYHKWILQQILRNLCGSHFNIESEYGK